MDTMRIAIVGYGKMGKMIHMAADRAGHDVKVIVDPFSNDKNVTVQEVRYIKKQDFDCLIDFSSPKTIIDNMKFYIDNAIPAVIGTTGWYDRLDEVKAMAEGTGAKLIWSGNYSLGVAVTMEIIRRAGQLFNKLDNYSVAVNEVHHRHKLDAPSGTGIMIANVLVDELDGKTRYTTNLNAQKDEISLTSQRIGEVPGIHTVTFDALEDTITIQHSARTREGFANGAVKAASWIIEQKPGVYCMDDFLSDFFRN